MYARLDSNQWPTESECVVAKNCKSLLFNALRLTKMVLYLILYLIPFVFCKFDNFFY